MKKYYMWMVTHASVVIMGIMLMINPQNWALLTPYSGYMAVGFLVLTLSLNPLKTLRPKWIGVTKLNRYRREFGVAAFSHATIHVLCFVIKRGGFKSLFPYLFHPALVPVVWVAMPIFFALGLTSNKRSIQKMGIVKWKKLHKKVYWAEGAILLHMILVGEALYAALLFSPVIALQGFRLWANRGHKGGGK